MFLVQRKCQMPGCGTGKILDGASSNTGFISQYKLLLKFRVKCYASSIKRVPYSFDRTRETLVFFTRSLLRGIHGGCIWSGFVANVTVPTEKRPF